MGFRSLGTASVLHALVIVALLAWCVWDFLQRRRAGPIRFRLPPASVTGAEAKWSGSMTKRRWKALIGVILLVFFALTINGSTTLFFALFYGSSYTSASLAFTRRDRARWAGWVEAGSVAGGGGRVAGVRRWGAGSAVRTLEVRFVGGDLADVLRCGGPGLWSVWSLSGCQHVTRHRAARTRGRDVLDDPPMDACHCAGLVAGREAEGFS